MKNTIFIILLVGFSAVLYAQKPKLAVMAMEDRSGKLSEKMISGGTTLLRMYLSSSGHFVDIDKGRQEKALVDIIEEKKKESYKKCYDEKCQIPLGQALSADTILRATVSELGGVFSLGVELVDLAKEATTKAASAEFDGTEEGLRTAVKKVVNELTGKTAEEQKLLLQQQQQAETERKIAAEKEKERLAQEKQKQLEQKQAEAQQKKLEEQKKKDARDRAFNKELHAAGAKRRGWGLASFLSGLAVSGAGIGMFGLVQSSNDKWHTAYSNYLGATTPEDAVKYRNDVDKYQKQETVSKVLGGVFIGVGAALVTTGIILWSVDSAAEKKVKKSYKISFRVDPFSKMATLSLKY